MKQLVALCMIVLSLAVTGQQLPTGTQTSPNLVYTTLNPYGGKPGTEPYTWTGFVTTESGGGGLSGGNVAGYNPTLGQFMFGYHQGTVAYRYALNTALQNSGMTWLGYNYSWEYFNQDYSRGTLSATVDFAATNGTLLHSKSWNLGATTEGWTKVQGTETFTNALAVSNIASFGLSFSGKDDRFWAGYYGPQVRSPSISVLYTFDQCSTNPLSSPSCPGYAQAYHDQQCSINPLSAVDCPGYYQAYQNQQCSANPLYSVSCPGYAQAYHDQQCSISALYATDCPGYTEAYNRKIATDNAVKSSTDSDTTTTKVTVVSTTTTTPDTTSPTSPTSIIGPVSVINPPAPSTSVQSAISSVSVEPPKSAEQQQQKAAEQKKTDTQVARAARGNVAAAARDAAERAQNAKSLDDQVATQGLVVGLMGYVPGFSAYQAANVPDVLGLAVARQYTKPNVDNRSAQRLLQGASDSLHQKMVEQQYK